MKGPAGISITIGTGCASAATAGAPVEASRATAAAATDVAPTSAKVAVAPTIVLRYPFDRIPAPWDLSPAHDKGLLQVSEK
jgi:hypothetical protein